jgi:acylphosphatase
VRLIPALPLTALLVTAGCLAAGFAVEASALDQRIEGFVDVNDDAHVDVVEATGQGDEGEVELVHLTVETRAGGPVDLDTLDVRTDEGSLAPLDVHAIRDEDGSLEEKILDGEDLARVVVDLGTPMEPREERTLGLDLAGDEDPWTLTTPKSLDDGYTRLEHERG